MVLHTTAKEASLPFFILSRSTNTDFHVVSGYSVDHGVFICSFTILCISSSVLPSFCMSSLFKSIFPWTCPSLVFLGTRRAQQTSLLLPCLLSEPPWVSQASWSYSKVTEATNTSILQISILDGDGSFLDLVLQHRLLHLPQKLRDE